MFASKKAKGAYNMNRFFRVTGLFLVVLIFITSFPTASAASAYECPGQQLVALTFDDGPCRNADAIMDTLRRYDAKATFFMSGDNLRYYPDQVQRMVREGHQIASHTCTHPYLTRCSDDTVRWEETECARRLTEITGLTGTGNTGFYLRPPFGSWNDRVRRLVQAPLLMWSVDTEDWKYKDADRLVKLVSAKVQDGDIVLMHQTVDSTAQGLDRLLMALEDMGYEFVTVEDLFWRRGIDPIPGQVYYKAPYNGTDRCAKAWYFDESQLHTHWTYGAIAFVRAKGIMGNNAHGEFTPNFPLTRGMFVTALGRLAGADGTARASGFSDLPVSHYAAPYAAWARDHGLMNGVGNGKFAPDEVLTRQEMAVTLARYARWKGVTEVPSSPIYADQADIADWARQEVTFCSGLGLLQGSNGWFRPEALTTRAMGATVIQRLADAFLPPPQTTSGNATGTRYRYPYESMMPCAFVAS